MAIYFYGLFYMGSPCLPRAERQERSGEIVLRHRPLARHVLTRIFFQSLTERGDRFFKAVQSGFATGGIWFAPDRRHLSPGVDDLDHRVTFATCSCVLGPGQT